jgi:hypothetical protein
VGWGGEVRSFKGGDILFILLRRCDGRPRGMCIDENKMRLRL